MATETKRRAENEPGEFYVDSTCIDCDTCRGMAPETFHRAGSRSAVHHQPEDPAAERRAMHALISCPTASIGRIHKSDSMAEIQGDFPLPVHGPVFHCGYHSEKSFGAASYFIQRDRGNVLVDSPRFARPLVRRLEELGGVRWMYLTHRDDVADHEKFRAHFGCDRILHADDVGANTRDVEIQPTGGDDYELAGDLRVIAVPGHTKGHTVLLFRDEFLFTGDHLAWAEGRGLYAFRNACWYSWPEQIKSMKRLLNYSFEWVLPGHGHRHHAPADEVHALLARCVEWMESK